MTCESRDKNEPEIIAALESVGAKVVLLEPSEPGLPDLLVGFHGETYLFEVKNPQAKQQLSYGQIRFHRLWPGRPIAVVRSGFESLKVIESTPSDTLKLPRNPTPEAQAEHHALRWFRGGEPYAVRLRDVFKPFFDEARRDAVKDEAT